MSTKFFKDYLSNGINLNIQHLNKTIIYVWKKNIFNGIVLN